jgi:predicted enzyme related to lactoylglutathione lyase
MQHLPKGEIDFLNFKILPNMKRVTALGGVFFKSKDPATLKNWYHNHLGLDTTDWGATFFWHPIGMPAQKARTEWSPMGEQTQYFQPSEKQFMINYRVENLEALLGLLRAEGVVIVGEMEVYDYGKFGWILDPEGNKIELWEPVDEVLNQFEADQSADSNP